MSMTRLSEESKGALLSREAVAREALGIKAKLLRANRRRLSAHDLEDAFAQAVLEVVQRAGKRGSFKTAQHVHHALAQKLDSRIRDFQRASNGRSPAALARR